MPKPLSRFLHTYKIEWVHLINNAGGACVGTSLAAAGALGVPVVAGSAIAGTLATGALIVGTGGVVLMALPLLYGVARATFLRKRRQDAFEKQRMLSTPDFNNNMDWDCYWTTVAVVGYERTGKTQFKKRLRGIGDLKGTPCNPTDNSEIHLSCVDADHKAYMALLDHAGATDLISAGQADLIEIAAEKARIFILVTDHADTEKDGVDAPIDDARLTKQAAFIRQSLINKVKIARQSFGFRMPLRAILMVMNKADAWESKGYSRRVREWTQEQVDELKNELSCDVQPHYLSVEDPSHPGFARLQQELIKLCKETQ